MIGGVGGVHFDLLAFGTRIVIELDDEAAGGEVGGCLGSFEFVYVHSVFVNAD